MPGKVFNAATSAQQVNLAVGQLDSLSTINCVAAQFLPKLLHDHLQPSSLIDIIEADPALTALALSLLSQHGINLPDGRFSLGQALDRLPAHEIRDAFLSIKISLASEFEDEPDSSNIQFRTGLLLHSLAVACCAKQIAEKATPQMDPQLAYCAGLLHDIGKLAIEQIMPKSFSILAEEAKSTQQSFHTIEQKNLGTDHTIIGKHLGQKWQLPNLITLAIWLHHSQSLTISREMPEARIAVLVQLADSIARQVGIGWSGSLDSPARAEPLAEALTVKTGQLDIISDNLRTTVEEKSKALGLDLPNAQARYHQAAHNAAKYFARKEAMLSEENRGLRSASSHLEFIRDLLIGTNPATPVINIAENLAVRWQKFYQTGRVCLYLAPHYGQQSIEAVVVQSLAQSRIITLHPPSEISSIPKNISDTFAIVNAHDYLRWLFEQLDIQFDAKQTMLLPLLCSGRAVGAIAFELHYPSDAELFEESLKTSSSIAGAVLGMAIENNKGQYYAERFAQLISSPSLPFKDDKSQQIIPTAVSLDTLAEMAAGVAHELNNPLAVIAGRAQLLADDESDQEKKQILEQIHKNSNIASEIIDDLMSFAEPPQPRAAETSTNQIIDEAVQLAIRKTNMEELDIQIDVADDVQSVFVDSAQIASAVASIISNALESYGDETGPVKVIAKADKPADLVSLTIIDNGCGMDAQLLQKATGPFFSAKPAGRKRGMGLAYAARLIKLNKGLLNIQSSPGVGTTVTISLPCK